MRHWIFSASLFALLGTAACESAMTSTAPDAATTDVVQPLDVTAADAPTPPPDLVDVTAPRDIVDAPMPAPMDVASAPEVVDALAPTDHPDVADVLVAQDVPPTFDPAADLAELTAGVRTINLGSSLASALVVHGERAFPVVYDANGATFIAAARAGLGRVVEYGHEGLANDPANTTDDRGVLVRNVVRWMSDGRSGAVVGMQGTRTALRDHLAAAGYTVRAATPATLDGLQVFITDAAQTRSADEVARIQAWVRAGGGLIVTGHAWYWGYSNSDPYRNFSGNQLLNDLGLTVTTDNDPTNNTAVPVRAPTDLEHAARALARVRDHTRGMSRLDMAQQVRASNTVRRAVRVMPVDSPYLTEVRALRAMLPDVIPTNAAPVRPATMPIPALTVVIDMKLARELPVTELRAHPAATDFPGAVTGAAGTFTRSVLASYAGRTHRLGGSNERPVWRSLGLYAPPGAQVTVRVPTALASDGRCDVMVGAHWDDNTGTDAWARVPVITRFFPLRAESTVVANAFGGLLYVRVPAGVSVGPADMTVTGAVEAPRYVRGVTTADDWRAQLARTGAPWAELETGKLVLTVPTSDARAVSDPDALMSFWDNVMDADADLAAIDRARPRAERIVFDRQIVAGYMHAGYPIEAFTPQARESLDLVTLRRSGNWGFFHEIGHNHQFTDWSWSGTGEATVNLWSVYAMERVVGLSPRTGHPAVTPTERAARVQAYVRDGRNFARDWSVWLGLETFLQLQEGFGWTLLTELNREYIALPENQRPANEGERIQRWIVRSSQRANRDLVPFYTAWGFPITQATRDATAALPAWAENPMR
jgi:hypothetical protein